MTAPELWLMAAAVFPILGAIGSLVGTIFRFPNWGLAAARLGFIGGSLCSSVLAFQLFSVEFNDLPSVHVSMWTWFSMTMPRLTSLVFGLEATWIKACLVSLLGGVILAYELSVDAKGGGPLSENVRLVDSLLYVAFTSFLFAPNLAQSLLGWLAISLLVSILIPLSRESVDPHQTRSGRFSVQSSEIGITDANQGLQRLKFSLSCVERFARERIWRGMTRSLPDWLGEQVEVVEESTVSFQVLAAILGSFAILLTWLIVG